MRFLILSLALSTMAAQAAPINDFTFKSPAFNGIGYSSHVLTIENKELLLRIIDTAGIGDTRGNLFIFKKI